MEKQERHESHNGYHRPQTEAMLGMMKELQAYNADIFDTVFYSLVPVSNGHPLSKYPLNLNEEQLSGLPERFQRVLAPESDLWEQSIARFIVVRVATEPFSKDLVRRNYFVYDSESEARLMEELVCTDAITMDDLKSRIDRTTKIIERLSARLRCLATIGLEEAEVTEIDLK